MLRGSTLDSLYCAISSKHKTKKTSYLFSDQDDKEMKATNATLIRNDGGKSYIVINGLENDKHYLFATVVMNGDLRSPRSNFTAGHPLLMEGWWKFHFYIPYDSIEQGQG